ncbi:MAG: hypothetical protein IKX14_08230 [Neisseriaceae bacterium]|nr:hypothetical protein [Neisseriaceae bacterium]
MFFPFNLMGYVFFNIFRLPERLNSRQFRYRVGFQPTNNAVSVDYSLFFEHSALSGGWWAGKPTL